MATPSKNISMPTRLSRLFYMVSPNDSMYETANEVPNYVAESTTAFQVLLVLELVVLWLQKKPMPRIPDLISSVGAGMISRFPSIFVRGIELITYCWIWENYRIYELPWDSVWTWILCLFAVDLGYYWVHRAAHEVNFMWAAHQVHHSSEDYNLSTALRQSVLQQYNSWIFYLPLALIIPPSSFLVHTQFNLLFQFWIHTEVVGWLGPLEYIINTPSSHRVHHGRNRYCIDKNYGGVFIIYDIIFGTYEPEKRDNSKDKVVYGLVHPLESWNPFYTQLCHWQYIVTTAIKERKGILNKILTFVYGPGWEPGKPRLGNVTDIPDISYPQPRYERDCPLWYNIYAMLHFLLVSLVNQMIHENRESMESFTIVISIFYILFTLTCLGSVFDKKSYGPSLELLRCLMVLLYACSVFDSSKFIHSVLVGIFLSSFFLFVVVVVRQARNTNKPQSSKNGKAQ